MLCLSGFELYSRWVPLMESHNRSFKMICAWGDHGRCNTALKNKVPDLPSLTTLSLVSKFHDPPPALTRLATDFSCFLNKLNSKKKFDKLK